MEDSVRQGKPARNWEMKASRLEDVPRISQLRSLFGSSESEAQYIRNYTNNPVQPGELWLAQSGEEVVGTCSIVPKRMKIGDRIAEVAEIGGVYTHPDFQRRGIFTSLGDKCRQRALENGILFVYGTPNDQALPGWEKRCGFAQIPSLKLMYMVRPNNMKAILAAFTRSKPLAVLGSPAVSLVYGTVFRPPNEARRLLQRDISITEGTSFPDDAPELWARVAHSYDMIIVRDKKYLEWRYPAGYTILTAKKGSSTLGYLVISNRRGGDNLTIGCIADFLVADDDRVVCKALLSKAISKFRDQKVDIIACWAAQEGVFHGILRKAGFLRWRRQPVICYLNGLGKDVVQSQYKWYFTMADSDNI